MKNGPPVHIDLRDFPPGMVAVPVVDWMWSLSVAALLDLSHTLPPGSRVLLNHARATIAANRTFLARDFLRDASLQWILFLDSDMRPPRHAAAQLLSREKDMIGGFCFARKPPYDVEFMLGGATGDRVRLAGVREVEWCGFGCMLIRRSVFEAVAEPWFEMLRPGVGEDEFFCRRARESGLHVYVDVDLEVGHVGAVAVDPAFVYAWRQTPAARRYNPVGTLELPDRRRKMNGGPGA